jgi:hypothetical protein
MEVFERHRRVVYRVKDRKIRIACSCIRVCICIGVAGFDAGLRYVLLTAEGAPDRKSGDCRMERSRTQALR